MDVPIETHGCQIDNLGFLSSVVFDLLEDVRTWESLPQTVSYSVRNDRMVQEIYSLSLR